MLIKLQEPQALLAGQFILLLIATEKACRLLLCLFCMTTQITKSEVHMHPLLQCCPTTSVQIRICC
jgi:hypothetical protein